MRVIMNLDFENFVNPSSDEAGKILAGLLSRHGIRGCFMTVAEKARALRSRGRLDIINIVKNHEVNYHSDLHSGAVTEFLDEVDWDRGINYLLSTESKGIRTVEEVFDQFPRAYTGPGGSWSPQVIVAMRRMGIPIMSYTPFEIAPGVPMWYCNALNLNYYLCLDGYYSDEDRLRKWRERFEALCDVRKETQGVISLFTYPIQLLIKGWPPRPSPYLGRSPREVWIPVEGRPKALVTSIVRDLDEFLSFLVKEAKAEFITYEDLYALCKQDDPGWIPVADVVELAKAIESRLTYHTCRGYCYSPAEIFGLIAHTFGCYRRDRSLPQLVPYRRIIGPLFSAPQRLREPIQLSADYVVEVSEDISWAMERSGHMPSGVKSESGGNAVTLGPGPFLGAMARLLIELWESGKLPEQVSSGQQPDMPDIVEQPVFRELRYFRVWVGYSPDFEGANLLQLAKLQSWSAKPATLR